MTFPGGHYLRSVAEGREGGGEGGSEASIRAPALCQVPTAPHPCLHNGLATATITWPAHIILGGIDGAPFLNTIPVLPSNFGNSYTKSHPFIMTDDLTWIFTQHHGQRVWTFLGMNLSWPDIWLLSVLGPRVAYIYHSYQCIQANV